MATTSEGITERWSPRACSPHLPLSHCSFPVSHVKPTGKIRNSSHFLLIQVVGNSLLPLSVTSLKQEVYVVDLTVPSSRAEKPCGCPYVAAEYNFFFFKSRKQDMLLRLWRLWSQFETGFSGIKVVYAKLSELISWWCWCSLLFTNFFTLNFETLIFFLDSFMCAISIQLKQEGNLYSLASVRFSCQLDYLALGLMTL